MDIQLSYLCVHLHTYVHTHMIMCTVYATHTNTVKKQRREKNSTMLSIILFFG